MITAGASRVAPDPLCLHAVATTPAGPMERIRSLLLHRLRPSPDYSWVGSCIISFVACSAFTHVTTYRLAKSPYATLYTGGSGGFVASTAAPIATGWSDPVPGRVYLPLWSSAFSRRTVNACLQTTVRIGAWWYATDPCVGGQLYSCFPLLPQTQLSVAKHRMSFPGQLAMSTTLRI